MGFTKFIDIKYFLISLVIGLLFVYFTVSDSRKIFVFPTPENVDILQYRDTADNCFSIEQEEVSCPIDKEKITEIKPQV
jgi:hypothetical protein